MHFTNTTIFLLSQCQLKEGTRICSSDVEVVATVVLVSLHVLSFDESFDPLLDYLGVGRELGRENLCAFGNQGGVVDLLAGLHDFDYGRIDDVLAVVLHLRRQVRLLRILLSLRVHKQPFNSNGEENDKAMYMTALHVAHVATKTHWNHNHW